MDSIEDHRSEEVDQPEQESFNDVGTGRSYECMFCKRGFTTAQALGGHMNIHRKDRAKTTRPNSSTKHNIEEGNYTGPRIYQPVFSSYPTPYFAAQEAQFRYQTYFPSANSTRISYDHQNNHNYNHSPDHQYQYQYQHQLISPCGEDSRMGLSLQYGSSYGEDMDQRKSYRVPSYEQDGLDLELRLGHDP